jgi:hypothetical protein
MDARLAVTRRALTSGAGSAPPRKFSRIDTPALPRAAGAHPAVRIGAGDGTVVGTTDVTYKRGGEDRL